MNFPHGIFDGWIESRRDDEGEIFYREKIFKQPGRSEKSRILLNKAGHQIVKHPVIAFSFVFLMIQQCGVGQYRFRYSEHLLRDGIKQEPGRRHAIDLDHLVSQYRNHIPFDYLLDQGVHYRLVPGLPDSSIVDLLKLFDEKHLSTLPVVDSQGIIEGLITRSTLVNTLSRQFIPAERGNETC